MLLAASIGVMALLLMMKFAEKVGTKALLLTVVLGYLGSVYGYFKTTNPMALVNDVIKYYPNVDQYFGFLEPKFVHYFPSNWFADTLYWHLKGNMSESLFSLSMLFGVSLLATGGMMLMGKKFFYNTWLVSMELRAKSKIEQTAKGFFSLIKKPFIDEQLSVMVRKELWHFLREPSQWIHFCIISVLIVIFVGSISHIQFQFQRGFLDAVSYMVIYVFNAFLISSIALRFVYPMMSIEGLSFWKVRSAPITLSKVYWLKFFLAFVPIVVLAEVLSVASHRPLADFPFLRYYAMFDVVFVTVSFVSMNLSAGSFFVNFLETNPIRVSSSQGATLTFLMGILYLVFLVVVLFVPLNNFFESVIKKQFFDPQNMLHSVIVISVVSTVLGVMCNVVGIRSIKRDF
jgi:ABC-2 type transport system permease protein